MYMNLLMIDYCQQVVLNGSRLHFNAVQPVLKRCIRQNLSSYRQKKFMHREDSLGTPRQPCVYESASRQQAEVLRAVLFHSLSNKCAILVSSTLVAAIWHRCEHCMTKVSLSSQHSPQKPLKQPPSFQSCKATLAQNTRAAPIPSPRYIALPNIA